MTALLATSSNTAPVPAPPAGVRVALCAPGEIWGGVEQFVDSLSRHLMSARVPVVVILLFDGPLRVKLERGGIPCVVVGTRGHAPSAVFKIARVLRDYDVTVMHTHGYKATILGAVAARLSGAKLVRTEHGRLEPGRGFGHMKMQFNTGLESLISRYAADAVVFVSRDVQRDSQSVRPGTLQQVIYNGLEPPPLAAVEALDGFDDRAGLFNLGIVGRLAPVKGHVHLFHALARLRGLVNLRLYVFGEGPLEEECRGICLANGLQDVVRFMGFRKNVQDYLRRMDLLAMPSLHEGLPYALLEAMYQGVAVVASRVGGLAETIEDGVTGLLVAPADPAALAEAIDRLHRDAPHRRTIAANARRVVCDRFLIDSMAAGYLDVYRRVVAAGIHQARA